MTAVIEESIVAGAILAGPQSEGETREAWEARVSAQAVEVSTLLGEKSRVRQAVEAVDRSKVFTAIITDVKKEKRTTRALVTFKSKPSKWHPDGVESARSERTDRSDGLVMAKRLVGLKDHLVRVWLEVEEFDGGKVRVIRHIQDLGEARGDEFDQES